jgi:Zn finger protein HypA/HybF involved in hydrogenase expression
MASAISGCVIVKDTGNSYTYQKKCEKCGDVIPGTISVSFIVKNSKRNLTFSCPKCKAHNKLVIQQ